MYLFTCQSFTSQSGSPWVEISSSQKVRLKSSINCYLFDLSFVFRQVKEVMGLLHLMVC